MFKVLVKQERLILISLTLKKEGKTNVSIASSNFVSYDEQTRTAPKDSTTIKCIKRETTVLQTIVRIII